VIPIGMGIVFLAYTGGIWGFCLVRGYNVTLADLFSGQTWPGSGKGTASGSKASSLWACSSRGRSARASSCTAG
jgi:hypothetical protein